MCSPSAPSWCSWRRVPCSAMYAEGAASFGTLGAVAQRRRPSRRLLRISRASRSSWLCSHSFAKMMYQDPIDMITRMISVPLATQSPCFQSASRPYGLSIVSLVTIGAIGTAAGAAGAAGAAAGAGASAGAALGASACAKVGAGAASPATASITVRTAAWRRMKRTICCLLVEDETNADRECVARWRRLGQLRPKINEA